ncbi:MAG: cupredoxin domain-containing protein [Armatimonadota bacterium]|nr:cupredoxin domain-containing protein [Armatimonadota bacterium]MDR7451438.1 cupredoxin domain-containing protein [Armatimonadota bacterium]MDR7466412.1 cupredoxin domain-containing protein [Armatimonadota bacterium]MDR7493134.1 cupredoxin domain-containing protein [Armatimonadota bacterium]MDR7498109.1 cupredoxin domain-containing protein [Armatimonadota bacterium]
MLRRRALGFALAALAVLAAAGFLATLPFRPPKATGPAPAESQRVILSMAGFEPRHLQARAGTDLAITFVNVDTSLHMDGGGWHQFRIEALNIDVRVPPRTAQTVRLGRIPAGTYVFYCDLCCGGKENPAMRGLLEVSG